MKVYEIKTVTPEGQHYAESVPMFMSFTTARKVAEALANNRGLRVINNPYTEEEPCHAVYIQCHNVVEL